MKNYRILTALTVVTLGIACTLAAEPQKGDQKALPKQEKPAPKKLILEKVLVGKWKVVGEKTVVIFKADGTALAIDGADKHPAKWKILKGNILQAIPEDDPKSKEEHKVKSFAKDKIVFYGTEKNDDDDLVTFKRVK